MVKAAVFLFLMLASSVSAVTNYPEAPRRLTPQQQQVLDAALPSKPTSQSQYLERLLLAMLVAEPLPGVDTPESVAKLIASHRLLFDLVGVSSDTLLESLSSDSAVYQKKQFPGLGITLQNGQLSERKSTFGRSIRGLFSSVDRRYIVLVDPFEFRIIVRDFGNMRDGARSGILMSTGQANQSESSLLSFRLNQSNLQQLREIVNSYSQLSFDDKRKVLMSILKLQLFAQSRRIEKSTILRQLLSPQPVLTQPQDARHVVVAEPTEHLSCPRGMPTEVSRSVIPSGGKPLVKAIAEQGISGMVIRTPVRGEEIIAVDFSKIPDKVQREYMQMMADLVRHKVEDPALSREERQAIIDGFKADVEHMMRTGTFNPVSHRTFASIFAEYILYNALSLGVGKLPWAMGMLQSTVVETAAPPMKFLDTAITAATCTAALPGLAGQVTQRRINPYAIVKEEGQSRFGVTHPDVLAQYQPSVLTQGAAMACSAAAGMVVMAGCNAAFSAVGIEDGTTSAVLAAGAVLVAKSAAEAAMLHAPTQKRIESVVRPAVGVSKSALSWLWGAAKNIAAAVTDVPDLQEDDIYLY